jgi:hypothetical protein
MPRNSPLDVMRLMLRIEMDGARDRLGQARRAEVKAETEFAEAVAVLAEESVGAAASDYARWLPAARGRLAGAGQAQAAARASLLPALAAVAQAEVAGRVLAAEVASRDLLRRRSRLAKEQRLLEDLRPLAISDPAQ